MKNTLFSEVSPHSLSVVGLRMLVIDESDGKQNWGALRNERKCNDGHDSRLAGPFTLPLRVAAICWENALVKI